MQHVGVTARLKIFVIAGLCIFFTAGPTTGGPGFRSSVRDLLGPQTPNSYGVYSIEQVVDNHTAKLGMGKRVRYIGVGSFQASSMSLPQAQDAYSYHKSAAHTHVARLEFDQARHAGTGDLLAYVFIRPWPNATNELFINAEMIRLGHAWYVPDKENTRYDELFRQLEDEAILARRGIWSGPLLKREVY